MDISGYELVSRASDEDFAALSRRIMFVLDPDALAPLELWKKLETVTKEEVIASIEKSGAAGFFVLFTGHPSRKSAIYRLSRAQASALIADNFDAETADGIDIVMCDETYTAAFLGNHDGVLLK